MNGLSSLGISLADYAGESFNPDPHFGSANTSPEALGELSKALAAGDQTGREVTDDLNASGAPLKVESLERSLKLITFRESDIRLWKRIPKTPAYNTVEEYNQLNSYGSNSYSGFNNEGELPRTEDSVYVRRAQLVKFLGVTKEVTHQMQLVRTHIGDAIQRETTNGILYILRKADGALFYGNESVIPQEFNGFYAQHQNNDLYSTVSSYYQNNEVVIDLKGKVLEEQEVQEAGEAIIRNFGQPGLLVAPPVVLTDFVKQYQDSKFIQPNTPQVTNGILGQTVQKFQTQFGQIDLEYDIFAQNPPPRSLTQGPTSPDAPATPITPNAAVVGVGIDVTSQWDASDAGDYRYAVAAVNRFGESQLLDLTPAALNVPEDAAVDLQWVDNGGVNPATGYVVYRTAAGNNAQDKFYPIIRIGVTEFANGYDNAAANTVRDNNRVIANTQQAFLIQDNNEVWEFKQLAPLMKMDLAILSPSKRFMILMYGTPFLYAPRKMVRFVNIGRNTP